MQLGDVWSGVCAKGTTKGFYFQVITGVTREFCFPQGSRQAFWTTEPSAEFLHQLKIKRCLISAAKGNVTKAHAVIFPYSIRSRHSLRVGRRKRHSCIKLLLSLSAQCRERVIIFAFRHAFFVHVLVQQTVFISFFDAGFPWQSGEWQIPLPLICMHHERQIIIVAGWQQCKWKFPWNG